ncbi:MAG: hypothetical protein KDK76_01140 [Chlamydiia bacterium]|nr:hypothetical protein [Chlamydiia bacterium]
MNPTYRKYLAPCSIALFIFLFGLIYISCIHRTKGFSCSKIQSRHGYDPRWDFGEPSEKQKIFLDKISKETFTLLGSGKECYAFVSEDGTIVIKFFKQKHMKTQYLLNSLPLSKQLKMIHRECVNRHRHLRERLFQSYQIAYERLQDHSGVLYLHLNKTNYLNQSIKLKTPKGQKFTLKLDNMEFLIQKRGYSIFDTIKASPEKGGEVIDAVLDYLTVRNKRGIGDDDINCERNLGLIDGKAMQIDLGELHFIPSTSPRKEELIQATLDLKAFLETCQPALIPYLEHEIEKRCSYGDV